MVNQCARLRSERSGFEPCAGDIVLCSQARRVTLTVPLSTQVFKWVPAILMLGVTLRWTSIPSRWEQKYSQSLKATETGISSGLVGHNYLLILKLHDQTFVAIAYLVPLLNVSFSLTKITLRNTCTMHFHCMLSLNNAKLQANKHLLLVLPPMLQHVAQSRTLVFFARHLTNQR